MSSSLIGRTVPNPYGAGTWSIEEVSTWSDGSINVLILWSGTGTANDGSRTIGSLAPGTVLWEALEADHARTAAREALIAREDDTIADNIDTIGCGEFGHGLGEIDAT